MLILSSCDVIHLTSSTFYPKMFCIQTSNCHNSVSQTICMSFGLLCPSSQHDNWRHPVLQPFFLWIRVTHYLKPVSPTLIRASLLWLCCTCGHWLLFVGGVSAPSRPSWPGCPTSCSHLPQDHLVCIRESYCLIEGCSGSLRLFDRLCGRFCSHNNSQGVVQELSQKSLPPPSSGLLESVRTVAGCPECHLRALAEQAWPL